MIDEMIGRKFGKHNQLEVVGACEKEKGQALKYQLVCSVCENDELYSGEIYTAIKRTLLQGQTPCHCSKNKRRTEEQQVRRVQKECALRDSVFLGFVGDYKNTDTKLKLRCLKDGHEWDTCSVDKFFQGKCCPKCAIRDSKLPDEDSIKCFMATGSFVEGTRFWFDPTPTRKKRWSYCCPVCSVDEYVQQGLCTGIFSSEKRSFIDGSLSCRCSGMYRWTPEQREYQINKKIKEEDLSYTFLGWKGEWKGANSTIHLFCHQHGDFFPNLTSFLYNKGVRCPDCAVSGFKRHEDAFVYVLYAEGISGDFTGYGITGNTKKRLREHRTYLSKDGFSIKEYYAFPVTGLEALRIERDIKENFTRYPQVVTGFKTEATFPQLYPELLEFVEVNSTVQPPH